MASPWDDPRWVGGGSGDVAASDDLGTGGRHSEGVHQ